MRIHRTKRGFSRVDFIDAYGQKSSLQKSSLASEPAIWLGVDVNLKNEVVNERMHLRKKDVAKLLPFLLSFVETGELLPAKREAQSVLDKWEALVWRKGEYQIGLNAGGKTFYAEYGHGDLGNDFESFNDAAIICRAHAELQKKKEKILHGN